jgi:hypothetical protein
MKHRLYNDALSDLGIGGYNHAMVLALEERLQHRSQAVQRYRNLIDQNLAFLVA